MINEKQVKRYCCDDISLIENYNEAIADSKIWECHHKAETDEKLTKKELIAQGRYFNRPASELIFLTKSAHLKLHYDAGTRENQREAARKACAETGRKTAAENNVKFKSKKVLQFTLDGIFVREWPSLHEIKRQFPKFNIGNICSCCLGHLKTAHKYIWRYA